ncbi:hypothetical protein [Phocaeicola vulgatus]|uniref:Transmembrane protein n=1 Tax=Phocaeicola vulgatus TaxID=821 RepID=A0A415BL73_PHOVU|nr:hypothetical protein [Phocaeicola vulgatus]RHI87054.1 hypothetical protein DW150_17905 [Phocaeicola vulgatus]
MKLTFISIREILQKQKEILKVDPNNKWTFFILPFLLGILCSALFYQDTKAIVDSLTLFLSIFIPIFISLLATLISFVMNKIKTRHNKERIPLIKETFYNICYLIPISLFLLVLSLLMNLTIGDKCIIYHDIITSPICNIIFSIDITIFFYGGIIHLIMNILMVTKRIFKLFDKEIDLLTHPEESEQTNKYETPIAEEEKKNDEVEDSIDN